MVTLIGIALKRPAAVPVTPVALLAYFMNAFTVASGVDAEVVKCFAELHTTEADKALSDLLESGIGSNQQFQHWTTILKAASREQILRQIRGEKLSATRKKMLKQALEG